MMYWILIPILLVLIGLSIELRARRSREQFPFPERARIINKAIRAGVDITITFWSRTRNRFLTRDIKPIELQGFYLKGVDKKSGEEIAVKVTRIKEIVPDQSLVEDVGERKADAPSWEKKRRRRSRRTVSSYLILAGAVGIVTVLAVHFFPKHRVLRIDIDENTQKFRVHKDVPIDSQAAVPVLPDDPAIELEKTLPAATVKTSTMTTTGQMWNVVVELDQVHTSLYVRDAFRKVFGYPRDVADKLALDIGQQGKLAVWSGPYDLATNYVHRLQKLSLLVNLEKVKTTDTPTDEL